MSTNLHALSAAHHLHHDCSHQTRVKLPFMFKVNLYPHDFNWGLRSVAAPATTLKRQCHFDAVDDDQHDISISVHLFIVLLPALGSFLLDPTRDIITCGNFRLKLPFQRVAATSNILLKLRDISLFLFFSLNIKMLPHFYMVFATSKMFLQLVNIYVNSEYLPKL